MVIMSFAGNQSAAAAGTASRRVIASVRAFITVHSNRANFRGDTYARLSAVCTGDREALGFAARYQTGAPVAGDVVVDPLGEHQQPVLKLDQVHQVDEDPGEPRKESADVQEAEIGHRLVAPNRRQVPLVEIMER